MALAPRSFRGDSNFFCEVGRLFFAQHELPAVAPAKGPGAVRQRAVFLLGLAFALKAELGIKRGLVVAWSRWKYREVQDLGCSSRSIADVVDVHRRDAQNQVGLNVVFDG